jgi:ATP-dependent protease ClpP protease subunit
MPGAIDAIYREGDDIVVYTKISGVSPAVFRNVADYLRWHPEIKKFVVELHTGGGSIMDAWRAVGIIKEMQASEIIVEMRVYGLSASAGVILMVAGDIGHRFVNSNAEIMIHKIWTFKMFALDTPDTAEDEAATLRHFQENINQFILSRSKMTKKELDECIFKKDFWMTGARAVELGLADGFIGK